MWMMMKLAWRNLFRNKRRTFIAGAAIGIGLACLIFTDALIVGTKDVMIQNLTASFLGDGQIHAQGFRGTIEVEKTIHRLSDVVAALEKDSRVSHFSVRAISLGMISSAADCRSVLLIGVEPQRERFLSQVDEAITQGGFFEGGSTLDIVIGSKLSADLEVSLGSRVVVTVAQARTGDLAQELFRVSGIYHFSSREMDSGMAFVRLQKAREMLAIENGAHEIALKFADPQIPNDASSAFWKDYSRTGNEVLGWPQLMPQLEAAFKLMEISLCFIALVLFGIVVFGIINTLFMSIYERIFEFGILRAVGTRPLKVGQLIVFEAAALGVVSTIMGLLLGTMTNWILSLTGIDYRGIEFEGITIRNLIYPVITARQFIVYPFWVLAFTAITGIYPAIHAARIKPAEAMRRSL